MADPVTCLIRYFVAQVPGAGRTQIAKFLYLTDLEARRVLGRPLTTLRYVWCDHGPFDEQIHDRLADLKNSELIREEQYASSYGGPAFRYTATGDGCPTPFGPAELAVVRQVADDIAKTALRDLLDDVVYQTSPMVDARERGARNQPLRMELVDNTAQTPGLDPSRAYQAVAEADAGQLAAHADVFARLRSRT
jgi:hypothetical protein